METKICKTCKRELPLDEEHFKKGRNGYLKGCNYCNYQECLRRGTRICKWCGEDKPLSKMFCVRDNYGEKLYTNECSTCKIQNYHKKRLEKDPDFAELHRQRSRDYLKKNPESHRQWREKIQEELSDSYIARTFNHTPLRSGDLTPELIELKRRKIKLDRIIKQSTKQ